MTKQIRIENADLSTYPVLVTVQRKCADGQWEDAEHHPLNNPTQMMAAHIYPGQRLIVEEREANGRTEPSKVQTVTDAMVSRFLSWNLPKNFYPDGGVSVDAVARNKGLITGTNLLNFEQAKAMLEHVLLDQPVQHHPV